jgi:hypothetical protein
VIALLVARCVSEFDAPILDAGGMATRSEMG